MFTLSIIKHKNVQSKMLLMRFVSYVQGQEPEPKIREYFYYVDHQGMVKVILLFRCI